jgi:hypothetical protein
MLVKCWSSRIAARGESEWKSSGSGRNSGQKVSNTGQMLVDAGNQNGSPAVPVGTVPVKRCQILVKCWSTRGIRMDVHESMRRGGGGPPPGPHSPGCSGAGRCPGGSGPAGPGRRRRRCRSRRS